MQDGRKAGETNSLFKAYQIQEYCRRKPKLQLSVGLGFDAEHRAGKATGFQAGRTVSDTFDQHEKVV